MADWPIEKLLVFAAPFVLIIIGILMFMLMRKTIRTRSRVDSKMKKDPDISDYVIVFDWTRKVLYFPTILASIAAGILSICYAGNMDIQYTIGSCWLGVFFLNFLIDEYELTFKLIMLFVLISLLTGIWLLYLGWLDDFLNLFKTLKISMSPAGYFTIAGIFTLAIMIAWVKGLFYYVAISSNYLNLQVGPTETGEQVNHTDYTTRIDTGDFLERLLGFGRIIITFNDHRKPSISMLTWRIGTKAQKLESLRGKISVERSSKDT